MVNWIRHSRQSGASSIAHRQRGVRPVRLWVHKIHSKHVVSVCHLSTIHIRAGIAISYIQGSLAEAESEGFPTLYRQTQQPMRLWKLWDTFNLVGTAAIAIHSCGCTSTLILRVVYRRARSSFGRITGVRGWQPMGFRSRQEREC
jgi:hypothetical protein